MVFAWPLVNVGALAVTVTGCEPSANVSSCAVRRNVADDCPAAIVAVGATEISAELLAESGLAGTDVSSWKFRTGRGCRECRGLGYRGRKAIAELLVLNDELRELIASRAPARSIKDLAKRSGTRFLRQAALDSVKAGETTLEEINRVTFVA